MFNGFTVIVLRPHPVYIGTGELGGVVTQENSDTEAQYRVRREGSELFLRIGWSSIMDRIEFSLERYGLVGSSSCIAELGNYN